MPRILVHWSVTSISIILGLLVLIGWAFDITGITSVFPDRASMKPNTAICFILLGIGLWVNGLAVTQALVRHSGNACISVVTLIGLITIGEYAFGWELNIDNLFFAKDEYTYLNPYAGRMGFNTALNFALLGIALLVLNIKAIFAEACVVLAILNACIVAIGYLFNIYPQTWLGIQIMQMAFHTTILFIILGVGVLWSIPDGRLRKLHVSGITGNLVTRRLLPLVVGLTLVTGSYQLWVEKTGYNNAVINMYILVGILIFALTYTVLWLASTFDELEFSQLSEKRLRYLTDQLKQTNKKLDELSHIDGLTQVANRRYMDEFLNNEWRRAIRNQSSISLILIDIDFFKQYNDNYGHIEGDKVLRKVASTIKNIIQRPGDLVARYGGEEFALILTDTTEAEHVANICLEAVSNLNIPHEYSSIDDRITISAGVCTVFPIKRTRPVELINLADQALYRAKENGRNRLEKVESKKLKSDFKVLKTS